MISFNPQCFFIDPPNCIYAVLARHNRRKRLINHLYSHLWKSWLYNIWVDQGRQPRIHRKGVPYSYITYRETVLVHTNVRQKTATEMERREQTVSSRSSMFSIGHCLIHNHANILCIFFIILKRFLSYDIYIYLSVSVWFVFFSSQLSIITHVTIKCHRSL